MGSEMCIRDRCNDIREHSETKTKELKGWLPAKAVLEDAKLLTQQDLKDVVMENPHKKKIPDATLGLIDLETLLKKSIQIQKEL